ncbi:hypothetical protein Mhypo_00670 [Meiothermus hypogaeus]|uniref:Uncharacterized protein n=1 Tax=Meiothermus hypogaeus TaxID=884155 RepID=A0ABX9MPZ5_9DEIN|nr:hypothetical protein Mhypo_00670 [Meiothermus hypogaeus]
MILRGQQGPDGYAIGHGQHGYFRTAQKLLDDNLGLLGSRKNVGHSLLGLLEAGGYRDPFASGQAGILDHDGGPHRLEVGKRIQHIAEGLVPGGRNAQALHQPLGKSLGALNHGSLLGRPENFESPGQKRIGNPLHQRRLRPHQGQFDALLVGPLGQLAHIAIPRNALGQLSHAGVAWRGIKFTDQRRLRYLPAHCMFAPTRTHYQDFHAAKNNRGWGAGGRGLDKDIAALRLIPFPATPFAPPRGRPGVLARGCERLGFPRYRPAVPAPGAAR